MRSDETATVKGVTWNVFFSFLDICLKDFITNDAETDETCKKCIYKPGRKTRWEQKDDKNKTRVKKTLVGNDALWQKQAVSKTAMKSSNKMEQAYRN